MSSSYFAEVPPIRFERGTLSAAASIVPQDGRTQRAVVAAKQRRAMHLAGEADRGNCLTLTGIEGEYCGVGRLPPVIRLLFRPIGVRA